MGGFRENLDAYDQTFLQIVRRVLRHRFQLIQIIAAGEITTHAMNNGYSCTIVLLELVQLVRQSLQHRSVEGILFVWSIQP